MTPLSSQQIQTIKTAVPGVLEHEPMAKHTNFRVGGPARLYVVAVDADALIRAVQAAEDAKIPWYVFGGGSNLLVADEGFEGLVIQSGLRDLQVDQNRVTAGSGVITGLAARKAADAGLTGFEWAIGVPGTIGGAVYGNAGCYGGEMKDVIETVDAYRVADRERVTYQNADCAFAYRESRFKKEPHLILGCAIRLTPGDAITAKRRMQEIVETRKEKQPLEKSSAGCAFKNFEFSDPVQIATLLENVAVPPEMIEQGRIGAGWLVEQAGACGLSVGGVSVSEKHGNFLVHTGNASAQDVLVLIHQVKDRIRERFGIELQEEVQLLEF